MVGFVKRDYGGHSSRAADASNESVSKEIQHEDNYRLNTTSVAQEFQLALAAGRTTIKVHINYNDVNH